MKKRSVTISGHSTSITLEEEFWQELKTIAASQNVSINTLISQIDDIQKKDTATHGQNLSSALRLYVLRTLKKTLAEQKEKYDQ